MKRYFYMMVLILSLFAMVHVAHARDTILVLSPVQSKQALDAQNKHLLNFLMKEIKPGEKAIVVDGQNFKTLFDFKVKDDPKYDHPKIKLRMNPNIIPAMKKFAQNPEMGDVQGSVQWSRLYDYLAHNFAPFKHDTTIVILASPLYQDKHNLEFGIMNNMYPSDGHLNASTDVSSFSVVGKQEYLKDVTIHIGFASDWVTNDLYRAKVTRFHHLFAEGYGAKIATFTGDMTSLWRRVSENSKAVPHGFKRDISEKLETIQVIDQPDEGAHTSIYERALETDKPIFAKLNQANEVQIGISWNKDWSTPIF